MGCQDLTSVLICDTCGTEHDLGIRHPDGRTACDHVDTHYGACIEERVADIVPISEIYELLTLE